MTSVYLLYYFGVVAINYYFYYYYYYSSNDVRNTILSGHGGINIDDVQYI
jgi:hypothetical protein